MFPPGGQVLIFPSLIKFPFLQSSYALSLAVPPPFLPLLGIWATFILSSPTKTKWKNILILLPTPRKW